MNDKIVEEVIKNPDNTIKLANFIIENFTAILYIFLIIYGLILLTLFLTKGVGKLYNIIIKQIKDKEIQEKEKEQLINEKKKIEIEEKKLYLLEKYVKECKEKDRLFYIFLEKLEYFPSLKDVKSIITTITGSERDFIVELKEKILIYIEPLEAGQKIHKDFSTIYTEVHRMYKNKIVDSYQGKLPEEVLAQIQNEGELICSSFLDDVQEYIEKEKFKELRIFLDLRKVEEDGLIFFSHQIDESVINQFHGWIKKASSELDNVGIIIK